MNYVVICSLGRSGSTLLQGILNHIPGYCVRGENWGLLFRLYQGYRSIIQSQITDPDGCQFIESPFYGADKLDTARYVKQVRNIMQNQLAPPSGTRVLGFKEVRWHSEALEGFNLHSYLRFIELVFPNFKMIFLTRDPQEVVKSSWWTQREPQEVEDLINVFYDSMKNCPKEYFKIDYKDLSIESRKLRSLFQYINEPFDKAVVKVALEKRYSY